MRKLKEGESGLAVWLEASSTCREKQIPQMRVVVHSPCKMLGKLYLLTNGYEEGCFWTRGEIEELNPSSLIRI